MKLMIVLFAMAVLANCDDPHCLSRTVQEFLTIHTRSSPCPWRTKLSRACYFRKSIRNFIYAALNQKTNETQFDRVLGLSAINEDIDDCSELTPLCDHDRNQETLADCVDYKICNSTTSATSRWMRTNCDKLRPMIEKVPQRKIEEIAIAFKYQCDELYKFD